MIDKRNTLRRRGIAIALTLAVTSASLCSAAPPRLQHEIESLRLAIQDLMETFGSEYPEGADYLERLNDLTASKRPLEPQLKSLRREALLANPLVDFDQLIVLKRKQGQLGLPTNHQCNTSLEQRGYDNEIAVVSPARGAASLKTLYRPQDGAYVGEIDLNFDADRLLFTMPNGRTWEIHELGIDGSGLRQVSREQEDVDNFDACYLPDGRIVFGSTASFTGVPCWHGQQRACALYTMNADGSGVRQLCFDQDLDLHPSVLPNGQVIYSRWDYTGIMHIYLRPLMVMNPDGTAQRSVYGSNSYYPNSLYYPRGIPQAPTKAVAILSGYHGVNRMGEMVVLDTAKGWREADGILHRIGHRGEPATPIIKDALVNNSWPKFLHPYPLNDKYFLAAAQMSRTTGWGVYLVDVFDNFVALAVDPKSDFFEPIPVKAVPKPPIVPERIDLTRNDATVYLHDVYAGPGLKDVPRGTVKRLRIVAYNFGYPGMAGPDKIGRAGPWDSMRILGTVPVPEDGSVNFRVPANTPISIQPLDEHGQALQLMRSWYTAMPGEQASCVGCHEQPRDTPLVRFEQAATSRVVEIDPWYGPPRGFDFEREVQPVLDKYCVGCHNGQPTEQGQQIVDLRSERLVPDYEGQPLSQLGASRLDPKLREAFPGNQPASKLIGDRKAKYTPAYDALNPLIRRVNVEDYVGLHVPLEYHASTSELIQMLRKGHHHVQLDQEAWERLYTWIDLNGPCHGTWSDVAEIPGDAADRRFQLAKLYRSATSNPEADAVADHPVVQPIIPSPESSPEPSSGSLPIADWPLTAEQARQRQRHGNWQRVLSLAPNLPLRMVRVPAGPFLMGQQDGLVDERPATTVRIERDFWIGACEITNAQYRQFDPEHFSGYFMKRSVDNNGPGVDMNAPDQPAVRVSWNSAMAFCRWLSERTGRSFTLPTEAQWEYACRAGADTPLAYGTVDEDFSYRANMADAAIRQIYNVTGGVVVLQDIPSDTRFNDGAITTTAVGSYQPNAWGLHDMHGNAAEWTRSLYATYPYRDEDGRNELRADGHRVVRGGSYYDRPPRCRAAFRLDFPAWQRVHNVGFRVVCEEDPLVAMRQTHLGD